jgi:hypothetical protein
MTENSSMTILELIEKLKEFPNHFYVKIQTTLYAVPAHFDISDVDISNRRKDTVILKVNDGVSYD